MHMQVQSVSDGSVSLVAQRDIAAGEDITLCYTNPFHGNDRMRRRGLTDILASRSSRAAGRIF